MTTLLVAIEKAVRRGSEVLDRIHSARLARRDLIRAALSRYVHQQSGAWKDEDVSALIDTVESLPNGVGEGPRPRRVLRGAAREEGGSGELAGYTADAHHQWRSRNPRLLDSPSEWEQRWTRWMADLDTFQRNRRSANPSS